MSFWLTTKIDQRLIEPLELLSRIRILEDLRFASLVQSPSVDLGIDDFIIEGKFFVPNGRIEDTISIIIPIAYSRGSAETLANRGRALPDPLYYRSLFGDCQV